jgi:hypothetical protein
MDESRDQAGVRRLYQELLYAWNNRSAAAMFQNTPAAFHGRPELAEKMTGELRQISS